MNRYIGKEIVKVMKKMINIKDKIVEQLEKVVDNLSDTYPQDFTNFPAASPLRGRELCL